jgi:hypothetical protein
MLAICNFLRELVRSRPLTPHGQFKGPFTFADFWQRFLFLDSTLLDQKCFFFCVIDGVMNRSQISVSLQSFLLIVVKITSAIGSYRISTHLLTHLRPKLNIIESEGMDRRLVFQTDVLFPVPLIFVRTAWPSRKIDSRRTLVYSREAGVWPPGRTRGKGDSEAEWGRERRGGDRGIGLALTTRHASRIQPSPRIQYADTSAAVILLPTVRGVTVQTVRKG